MNTTTADALRIAIQDLDASIEHVRICLRRNHKRTAEFVAEYRRLVKWVAELQDARQAESNIVLVICQPFLPKPFAQPVGFKGEAYFNRGWAGFEVPSLPVTALKRAA